MNLVSIAAVTKVAAVHFHLEANGTVKHVHRNDVFAIALDNLGHVHPVVYDNFQIVPLVAGKNELVVTWPFEDRPRYLAMLSEATAELQRRAAAAA